MVLVIAWCRHHTAVLLLALYAPVYIILDPAAVLLAGAANLLVYAVVSALLTLDRSMLPGMSQVLWVVWLRVGSTERLHLVAYKQASVHLC